MSKNLVNKILEFASSKKPVPAPNAARTGGHWVTASGKHIFIGPDGVAQAPGSHPQDKEFRQVEVPVHSNLFTRLGIPSAQLVADYINLDRKHQDEFLGPEDVKNHVEHVLEAPTHILPGDPGHIILVRQNGNDKSAVLDIERRGSRPDKFDSAKQFGGRYHIRSAYTLNKGQLQARIADAPEGWKADFTTEPAGGSHTPGPASDAKAWLLQLRPGGTAPSDADSAGSGELIISFSGDAAQPFELVRARISRTGNYPDKGVTLTEADFDLAAAQITPGSPAPMNLAHVRRGVPIFSSLPGGLGDVRKLWREGQELFGEIAVPRWMLNLARQAGVDRIPLSAEWDSSKRFIGCAYEKHPRISDTQLLAAFTHSAAIPLTPSKGTPPTMLKKLLALLPWLKTDDGAVAAFAAVLEDAKDDQPADFSAQLKPLEEQVGALRASAIKSEAEAFADAKIREKKALPSERAGLIALFTTAATDDAASATTIEFTVGEGEKAQPVKGTRVDALKATVDARSPHSLTDELLPDDATVFTAAQKRERQVPLDPRKIHAAKLKSERDA